MLLEGQKCGSKWFTQGLDADRMKEPDLCVLILLPSPVPITRGPLEREELGLSMDLVATCPPQPLPAMRPVLI